MPIITISMYSGRTQREKDRLAEAMTEDIVNIIKGKARRGNYSISRSTSRKLVFFWSSSIMLRRNNWEQTHLN